MAIIHQLPLATFHAADHPQGNELFLDGAEGSNDPVKFRFGTFDVGNYFTALSGDVLQWVNGQLRRLEKVFIALKPAHNGVGAGGCIETYCQRDNTDDDANMVRAMRVTATEVEVFGRRLATLQPDGSFAWHVGAPTQSARFFSPNGRYCWNYQNDGHQVQYDTHNSSNEATWTPVWSNWNGLMKPLPW